MKKTRFMSKLFSDEAYQEKVTAKMDEAHENGSASLEEDGENLQFADVEGDIIVEDKTDGMSEVTRISPNPDDDNDFIVSAVEVPAEFSEEEEVPAETSEKEVEEKTISESDNLASIEITQIPGADGKADDIVDDLEIEVETGITDEEKSGTNAYSLKFKNYSKKRAQMFAKIFSHCADCFDEVVKSADVDEDVQVKFEDGKMKVMSITFGTKSRTFSEAEEETPTETPDDEPNTDLTEIIDSANKLAEMADAGINKDNADEIKTLAEDIINKAEACENDEVSLMCIKNMCGRFSEEAAKVADETEEEKVPEDAEKVETAAEEQVETAEEEKLESNASPQVKQCPETGKWYIEEDPEKTLYETQEEAEQVAAKSFCNDKQFSDPKVTVTIEDLEPASVGDLLGYKKEEESKEDELAPKVDPNEGGTGRQFSMTASTKKSINPLLYTEIN